MTTLDPNSIPTKKKKLLKKILSTRRKIPFFHWIAVNSSFHHQCTNIKNNYKGISFQPSSLDILQQSSESFSLRPFPVSPFSVLPAASSGLLYLHRIQSRYVSDFSPSQNAPKGFFYNWGRARIETRVQKYLIPSAFPL